MTVTTRLCKVTSVIDGWPHRGGRYDGVEVDWFVDSRPTDPGFDYAALLDGYETADGQYARGLVDELFTPGEARQFAAYLKTEHDSETVTTDVRLPVATKSEDGAVYLPIGASVVGGPSDFYMLSEEPGYSLPFKVWGYYCMEGQYSPPLLVAYRAPDGSERDVVPPRPYAYPGYDLLAGQEAPLF